MSKWAPGEDRQAEALRGALYAQGAPGRTELVGLVSLVSQADRPAMRALLWDVARDALAPGGEIACADCDWLMDLCGDGHGVPGPAEFVVLASALRHARPAPAELVAFAAREIERAILTGERAAIGGVDGEPGRVEASDVLALAEIAAAAPPDRALAEVFFDIAHATAAADNDPGFDTLFAETLRRYLLDVAPAVSQAQGFWAALAETPVAPDSLADGSYEDAAEAAEARDEAAARLPAPEARWALTHLSRGALSSAERRLISRLREPETARAA